ncbi:uncharacterized protein LOC129395657 [Pan paniscus]|uniref:uncharacterized protein LOC129395657 n=1 Tax=Pan paniscus TaxID=9597 RepID=UPI0030047BF5
MPRTTPAPADTHVGATAGDSSPLLTRPFQLCNHTHLGTQKSKDFGFWEAAQRVMEITPRHHQSALFMVGTTTVSDRLWNSDFRSCRSCTAGTGRPRCLGSEPEADCSAQGLTTSGLRARRRPCAVPGAVDWPSAGPRLPHRRRRHGQPPEPSFLHAAQADSKPSGRPPDPRGEPPTWSRRRAPGDTNKGPTSGPRQRPTRRSRVWSQTGQPQPKRVSRSGREDPQVGWGAQTGKTRDREGKVTREPTEGRLGEKPQAWPGHQENAAMGSHRHRHEGGPSALRLGRQMALGTHRDPPHEPWFPPSGPQSDLSHKPNARATLLISRPSSDPVKLRETGVAPTWDAS